MPSFGQSADWLDAGPDLGSAFGSFGAPAASSNLNSFGDWNGGITQFDTPSTMANIGQMLNDYTSRKYGDLQPSAGYGATPLGGMASLGGDWAGVDQWDSAVGAASSKFGVPANLIKAVMKLESGGANLGRNGVGAIGPMQVVDTYWGNLGYNLYDPAQNIMAGAYVLKHNYDQWAGWAQQNGVDPWQAALYGYYAGNPYNLNARDNPSQGGSGMRAGDYGDQIWQTYQNLNQFSGPGAGLSSGFAGSTNGSLGAIFPNGTVPEWGEFDAPSNLGYYTYGNQYGMNGVNHTGVDVPMPLNTAYRAPMGGTVTCGGTGTGIGATGDGCGAFNDYYGNGAGRVEVLLDNGAVLIFGHSSTSALQIGMRFNPGDILGTSGGMNSPHIHLEARVRDPSTPSGWRIVDPRSVLGGGGLAVGMPGMGGSRGGQSGGSKWGNTIINLMTGGRQ